MIILDTNVVSEMFKPTSNTHVASWLNRQTEATLYLTAISVAEMQAGVARMPEGRRKEELRSTVDDAIKGFTNPILPFDCEAAYKLAELLVRAKINRYTVPIADGYIAAIAAVHGYTVATRDVDPFVMAGVAVINPWEEYAE